MSELKQIANRIQGNLQKADPSKEPARGNPEPAQPTGATQPAVQHQRDGQLPKVFHATRPDPRLPVPVVDNTAGRQQPIHAVQQVTRITFDKKYLLKAFFFFFN